jgi:hypothetical protein
MVRENDMLKQMLSGMPAKKAGHTKTASFDQIISDALSVFTKKAQDEEKKEETPPAGESAPPAADPNNLPPEFLAQQAEGAPSEERTGEEEKEDSSEEEKKESPEEEKKEEAAEEAAGEASESKEEKEVMASIGRWVMAQTGQKTAAKAPVLTDHEKVAQAAISDRDEFMQKVAASAFADEMAKIAYWQAAGMDFPTYMRKIASRPK